MTKLFKNSKQLLACVMAFAVLAVSLFTGVAINADAATVAHGEIDLLEFGQYLKDAGSSSAYYDDKVADNGEAGTEADPIIIDSAEEFVYLAKASGNETAGKYYKVADGIAGFDLSKGDINYNGTLEENIEKVSTSGKNHSGGEPGFQGTFDGNGVTVYGATINGVPSYMGLFSCTKGNVTIKNVNVKLAYFAATYATGGIVGYHKGDGTNTLTIENCSVVDCYLESKGTGYGSGVGAFVGYINNCAQVDGAWVNGPLIIKNCFAKLDEEYFISNTETTANTADRDCHGGVVGFAVTNALMCSDSIIVGITPYATTNNTTNNDVQHNGFPHHFENVYTTAATGVINVGGSQGAGKDFSGKVIQLTEAQMKGVAATGLNLDWSVWMADDTGYPELRISHKDVTVVDNGDGTHSEVCACGFGGVRVSHIYDGGACACGAELDCSTRSTIYWDGSVASGIANGSGTKADPYVIKSAAELAWLIQQKADVTGGKYYEIDKAIGTIVLQTADKADTIMGLANAAAVKAYFEANAASMKNWPFVGWEQSCFAGQFNGNGVTVYGLYQISTNNAGLFSTVDGGAAIRNIAVKNSYYKSTADNYQVAAIASVTSNTGYGMKTEGIVWFEGCVVANCYLYNTSTQPYRSGVIAGSLTADTCQIDNCLVYGNDATYGAGVKMPIVAIVKNAVLASGPRPDGIEPKIQENEDPNLIYYYHKVNNTVVLGADIANINDSFGYRKNEPACYSNVYTDGIGADGKIVFSNMEANYAPEQVKGITAADVADIDLGDAFIATGAMPELKAFHDAELTASYDETGHGFACSCGVGSEFAAHTFGTEVDAEQGYGYGCTECDYVCDCWTMNEWSEAEVKDPTCTEDGAIIYKCDICGFVDTENPDVGDSATGHNLSKVPGKAPTCTEAGVKDYYECTNKGCDAVFADANETEIEGDFDAWKVIPANGHTHAIDKDGVAIYKVTEAGHQAVCADCDEAYGDVESHVGAPVANGAEGHKITCTVAGCGFAAENAAHNFGEDNVCDTCEWACTAHNYVDGESTELGWDATPTACILVEQICSICGNKGEDKVIGHELGDWERPFMDFNEQPACAGEGQHTEVKVCSVCWNQIETRIVKDAKTGHSFVEYEAEDATCSSEGCIAYKQCENCWNCFALDAADDEAYENALSYEDMAIEINADNHNWLELGSDATCDEDGIVEHKYCLDCNAIVIGDEMVEAEIDWDAYYEYDDEGNPVGVGAILDSSYNKLENEALAEFIANNYASSGIEVPAYPEDESDWEAMSAYYEEYDAIFFALYEIDENVYTAWEEYWMPLWEAIQIGVRYEYVVAAADVDLVAPATGHELVKVDEVAATYDKEGMKAHYACECGKLYADAEGEEEVTAADLVIAKLVKEEAEEDKPADKPAGDDSDKSPATGESVASVAAVAALMGAAFVLVRKSKKA